MRVVQMNPNTPPRDTGKLPPPVREYIPHVQKKKSPFNFDIKNFKADDWILLGIIATLIIEGSTDYILLIALGYLFIMGL